MAGHLTRHPYLKTFDELERTYRRMETYLDIYADTINEIEKENIRTMITHIKDALSFVPVSYKVSRWNQFKNK
jgi:hypothetical protein